MWDRKRTGFIECVNLIWWWEQYQSFSVVIYKRHTLIIIPTILDQISYQSVLVVKRFHLRQNNRQMMLLLYQDKQEMKCILVLVDVQEFQSDYLHIHTPTISIMLIYNNNIKWVSLQIKFEGKLKEQKQEWITTMQRLITYFGYDLASQSQYRCLMTRFQEQSRWNYEKKCPQSYQQTTECLSPIYFCYHHHSWMHKFWIDFDRVVATIQQSIQMLM